MKCNYAASEIRIGFSSFVDCSTNHTLAKFPGTAREKKQLR